MFEIATGLYQATIHGQKSATLIMYKIEAYDKSGNMAINDNNGYNYSFQVVPEFPILIPIIIAVVILTLVITKYRRRILKIMRE